jgi:hypothetical protein
MRLSWLANQFSLYTSRLTGFANSPTVEVSALRNSDLFRAVEVSANELAREIQYETANVQERWKEVARALKEVQREWTAPRVARLQKLAQTWRRGDAAPADISPAV